MSSFWQDKVAPAVTESDLPQANQAAYQRHMAGISGSAIYRPGPTAEQLAARRPSLYADSPAYAGLESYQGKRTDPLDARPGESPESHRRRILAVARALPDEEVEARLAAIDAGVTSHDQLRAQLDNRKSGTGIDQLGTPQERAAALGSRFGARSIAGQGHVNVEALAASQPISASEVNVIMRQREEQRTQPQHTEVSTLRSSGAGFLGVNR